jgi:hypothetical protein
MGISVPFLTNISSHKNVLADALNCYCMQFLSSGNPVYPKGANHRPSFTAKQEWRIKKQYLIDNTFTQSGGGNATTAFNKDRFMPPPPEFDKQRPERDLTVLSR